MYTHIIIALAMLLGISATTFAQAPTDSRQAFQSVKNISPIDIIVPTVVELPVEVSNMQQGIKELYAVYEIATNTFVPYSTRDVYEQTPAVVYAYSGSQNDSALTDGNVKTSVDYLLDENQSGTAVIRLQSDEMIESSSIYLGLDKNVALPTSVSVTAFVDGYAQQTILAPIRPTSRTISFPKIRAKEWTITVQYVQPLRINEITLVQDSVESSVKKSIRFLAQPGSSYMVYHDADRSFGITTLERGNLSDGGDVRMLSPVQSVKNTLYVQADQDGDGIPDTRDNCPRVENQSQTDIDGNGKGDDCDDFDRDGIMQSVDNCSNLTNAQQYDTDGDGIGDACDDEESRFTEKYAWVPWVGMGVAALVIATLFMLVAFTPKREEPIV